MTFDQLFDVNSAGYRIDLLTHAGRADITNKTVAWWQSQGWQVVLWDNTGYKPAVGRNKIINDFKQSNRSSLIMADDDITLYTHRYLTADWLKNPLNNGVYTLNSNLKMHALMQYSRDWDCWQQGQHYWTTSHHVGGFVCVDRKDIPLQDETLPALEDIDWAWQCWSQGITTQMLHTVFFREQSQDRGSIFCRDRRQRAEIYRNARAQMLSKWAVKNIREFKKKYAFK